MHIPDGYLSPQTYIPLWVVAAGYWAIALERIRKTLAAVKLPLLAFGAAFSFVVMMFNVPIPGGTTGHAVGAGLLAIMLGPWAASIAISVALLVQALLFGDGGITAIGANVFTMAIVAPWVAWGVYRLVSGASDLKSGRRVLAAGLASYLSLTAAALCAGVLFGIQPLIAHTASGQPLYGPYPLWVAVPSMLLEHMLLFSLVEAAVAMAAVAWLQRVDVSLLAGAVLGKGASPAAGAPAPAASPAPPKYRKLWILLAVMVVLTPLGLWIPTLFGAGSAWGEWGPAELQKLVGFVPKGFSQLQSAWSAALPGYTIPGLSGPVGEAVGYIIAAVVGVALVAGIGYGLTWLLGRRARDGKQPPQRPSAGGAA